MRGATELVKELENQSLAITLAASYLNRNQMSIVEYLRLHRNTKLISEEFREDMRLANSNDVLATTWLVSWRRIREQDGLAAQLLVFMSLIEPRAVPQHLLQRRCCPQKNIEQAIDTLCRYAFIVPSRDKNPELDEELYEVPEPVHTATWIWVSKHGDLEGPAASAVQHLSNIWPAVEYENRVFWIAYLPHAMRLLKNLQKHDVEGKAELCTLVGDRLRDEGRIKEAVEILEEACKLNESLENVMRTDCRRNTSLVCRCTQMARSEDQSYC